MLTVPARWPVAALFVVSGGALGIWVPFVPHVMQRLDLDTSTLGLLLGLVALTAGVAMLLTGQAVLRVGSRATALAGGAGVAIAVSLPLHAGSLAALAMVMALLGVAYGVLDVSMNTQAAAVERAIGRPAMSLFHGCYSLGTFAGAGVATALLAAGVPHATGMAVAACGLALLVALAARRLAPEPALSTAGVARTDARLLMLGVLAALAMALESGVENWTTVWRAGHARAAADGAAIFSAYAGAVTVSRFVGDRLVARLGRWRVFRASGVLASAGLFVGLSADVPAIVATGFVIGGLGTGNLVPLLFAEAASRSSSAPSVAIARVATFGYIGLLASPPLVGVLASAIGLESALRIVAAIGLVCVVATRRQS